ncbi:MAG: hypothetical protein IJU52_07440 [Clostridia bacterium]|nr:hypothetical protein [Clostridia bacterium]
METDKRSPAETDRGIGMQNENGRAEESYAAAVRVMNAANSEVGFRSAAKMFGEAGGFRDAAALGKHCLEQAENCRRDAIYDAAKAQMAEETLSGFDAAARGFSSIPGWKDADELLPVCREGFVKLKKEKDALYAEKKRKEEEDRKRCAKRRKRMKVLLAAAVIAMIALIAFLFVWQYAILPGVRYDSAVELYRAGEFEEARSAFLELKGYGDSREWVRTCIAAIKDRKYSDAVKMFEDGRFEDAKAVFTGLEDYRDSRSYAIRCNDRLLEQTYTVQMSALKDAAVGSYVKYG